MKSVVISFGSTEYGVMINWFATIHNAYTTKYAHTGRPGTHINAVTSNTGMPNRIRKRRRPNLRPTLYRYRLSDNVPNTKAENAANIVAIPTIDDACAIFNPANVVQNNVRYDAT
ncbi:hypothetical protein COO72_12525 [Bifidobacterium callitrichos]|nr:hypothetical protein COO72_12525 [Bifidobacterium callitrichos]